MATIGVGVVERDQRLGEIGGGDLARLAVDDERFRVSISQSMGSRVRVPSRSKSSMLRVASRAAPFDRGGGDQGIESEHQPAAARFAWPARRSPRQLRNPTSTATCAPRNRFERLARYRASQLRPFRSPPAATFNAVGDLVKNDRADSGFSQRRDEARHLRLWRQPQQVPRSHSCRAVT